jgi:hypothetical protein
MPSYAPIPEYISYTEPRDASWIGLESDSLGLSDRTITFKPVFRLLRYTRETITRRVVVPKADATSIPAFVPIDSPLLFVSG